MENSFKYTRMTDMSVEMQAQERRNMVVLRGRALLNEDESRLTFIQNEKRGVRSVEVGRGSHFRIVRRPDGLYTLTFRFDASEKCLRELMVAEIRKAFNFAKVDYDREEMKRKEKKDAERREDTGSESGLSENTEA